MIVTEQRQDAWTDEEDLILAEIVLQHIREGSTQLAAFKEIGKRLSRTAAACGFRWNSTVRKKYVKAISLAKQQRKLNNGSQVTEGSPSMNIEKTLTLAEVIAFLQELATNKQDVQKLKNENEKLLDEIKKLETEYEGKLSMLRSENDMLKKDYKTMIEIFDRASKVVSLNRTTGTAEEG